MARPYDVQEVELKWQQRWAESHLYEVDADDPRPRSTSCACTPTRAAPPIRATSGTTPSATCSCGIAPCRASPCSLLSASTPSGFPAENAAIRTGEHPRAFTEARIAELKASVKRLGAVYDWRREVRSHDPSYIRWNQVIFLRLLEAGLAYRVPGPGQLVPGLPDGAGQRAGPGRRDLRALGRPGGPTRARAVVLPHHRLRRRAARLASTTWTGPSGSRPCSATGSADPKGSNSTSRSSARARGPGSAGLHDPARHELRDDLRRRGARAPPASTCSRPMRSGPRSKACGHRPQGKSELDRTSEHGDDVLAKRGAFTGGHVVNPFTGEAIPVYVADYVLMRYGTGAIMAVPAEDERDWDFAQAHGLPVVRTTAAPRRLRRRAVDRRRSQDQLRVPRRPGRGRGQGARHRLARGAGDRTADRQLPPAGLAGVAPALLGMPHPRGLLPRRRDRRRSRGRAPRPRPRRRRVPPHRRVTSEAPSDVSSYDVPASAGARPSARPTPWTPSSTRRGTSCASATRGPTTSPSTRPRRGTSCPSTSTSVASSTPSCTFSTRASTPGP